MKRCIWAFILGVAVLDVSFTWKCRDSVKEWECNPVASQLMERGGTTAVILYRALWLAFAACMATTKTRISALITPVWCLGHLYLLLVLLQALPWAMMLAG